MKVSDEAEKKLKAILALPENSGKAARIVVSGFSCCGPKFSVVFEGSKLNNDDEIKKEGYSIVFEKRIAGFLEDAVVEYKETWSGEPSFAVEIAQSGGGCCG